MPPASYQTFSGVPDRKTTRSGRLSRLTCRPVVSVTVSGKDSDESEMAGLALADGATEGAGDSASGAGVPHPETTTSRPAIRNPRKRRSIVLLLGAVRSK